MKALRTVRYSLIAAAVAGTAVLSTPATAEVSATANVANIYLWRGLDLGMGSPQVAGSLDYAHESGLFAGVWGSSAGPGTETDLYAGWGKTFGDFGVKVTYISYTYPMDTDANFDEISLNATFKGFFVDYFAGTGETGSNAAPADNKNNYVDIGYTYDKYTIKYGMTQNDAADSDYTHVDATYAYNDNLSFTLSGVIDSDDFAVTVGEQDPLFVVSYSLPLDLK